MIAKQSGVQARKTGALGAGGVGIVAALAMGTPPFGSSAFAGPPSASGRKPPTSGPGCLYGQVVDGHSGEIRCLSPAEVTPPGPYDTPVDHTDAGTDAGAPA